jgi:hypothetical protein
MEEFTKEEAIRLYNLFHDDMEAFVDFFCSDVATAKIPDFHREMYKALRDEDRAVIAAPRGFAKSTVAKLYLLHCALFKKRKDILLVSASQSLAVEHLRYLKLKIENDPKIELFFGNIQGDKWTENHIQIRHNDGTLINLRAIGAGAQIRGTRPDCILLDDMEKDDEVESEDQRKKLTVWLNKACINTLLEGSQLIMVGTIIHPLSVLCHVLETKTTWHRRKYQAYVDGREEKGKELWPEARTHEWLQNRKAEIGSWAFAAEYMNNPMLDESAAIKPEMIRYWSELPKDMNLVIAVDPAYSEDANADWKVASLVGISSSYNRYLVHYIRTHESLGDFMDSILNLYMQNKNQVIAVGIPDGGVEKSFFSSFLKRGEERGIFAPVVPLKNVFHAKTGASIRNKKSRIVAALQPLFEQGRYYIHENQIEAKDELLLIGSSRHDDLVDSLAYAEQLLQPPYERSKEDPYYEDQDDDSGLVGAYGIEY